MAELLMNLMASHSQQPPPPSQPRSLPQPTPPITGSVGIMPDLSHLSELERPIIESVIMRQKKEEQEEAELLRRKQDEVMLLEQSIRQRNEEHVRRRGSNDLEATCQICLKTKFADGVGHQCNYCYTRCCARCGGKVTLRSNKNIWVCMLCRKKQELLVKTGQWIHSSMANRLRQLESTTGSTPTATETPLIERLMSFGGSGGGGSSSQSAAVQQQQQQPSKQLPQIHHQNPCLNFLRRNSLGFFPSQQPLSSSSFSSTSSYPNASASATVQQQQQQQPQLSLQQQPSTTIGRQLKRQLSHETAVNYSMLQQQQQQQPSMVRQRPLHPQQSQWSSSSLSSSSANVIQNPAAIAVDEQSSPKQGVTQPRRRHILPRQPSLPCSSQPPFILSQQNYHQSHHHQLQQQQQQPSTISNIHQKVPLESSSSMINTTTTVATTTTDTANTSTGSGRKLPTQRRKSRELPSLDDLMSIRSMQQQHNPTPSSSQQSTTPKLSPQISTSATSSPKKLPQLPRRTTSITLLPPTITTTNSGGDNNDSSNTATKVPSGSGGSGQSSQIIADQSQSHHLKHQQPPPLIGVVGQAGGYSRSYSGGDGSGVSQARNTAGIKGQRLFLSAGSLVRNDSVGSDPGEVRRPTPPPGGRQLPFANIQRPKLRDRLKMHHLYNRSFSSSEDNTDTGGIGPGARSWTPELSTEDDFDTFDSCESSGIISADTKQLSGSSGQVLQPRRGRALPRATISTVGLKSEDILDTKMKTFLAHPITWEKSPEGTHMIGRMILKKNLMPDTGLSSSAMLGMKVVGGRIVESGRLGAIIEKVKKGSIADTIGRLRPGDEVLEWNGISLVGKTYDEVHDIIADSKHHSEIELVVARPLNIIDTMPLSGVTTATGRKLPRHPLVQMAAASSRDELMIQQQNNRIGRRHTDVISSTAQPRSLDIVMDKNDFFTRGSSLGSEFSARHMRTTPYVKVTRTPTITGRIQVKLYYDGQTLELFVTIMNAIDLSPRKTGLLRNPYCTVYLLPDQTEKTLRKTTTVINTLEPVWNQTFHYSPLSIQEIRCRALELTICDYDHFLSNEFLGATIIDLQHAQLDDEPEWYCLCTLEDVQQIKHRWRSYYKISAETSTGTSGVGASGLSPPTHSNTSISARFSDSDVASELSLDDFDSKADSWRCLLADTSQSGSMGSGGSGSSPPLAIGTTADVIGGGGGAAGTSGVRNSRYRTYQSASNTTGSYQHRQHHHPHQHHHLAAGGTTTTTTTSAIHHPRIHHHSGVGGGISMSFAANQQQQQQLASGSRLTTTSTHYPQQPQHHRNLPSLSTSSLPAIIPGTVYPGPGASGDIGGGGVGGILANPIVGIGDNMMPPTSDDLQMMRPEFRKSSSQPTATTTQHTISPPPIVTVVPGFGSTTAASQHLQNPLMSQSTLNYPLGQSGLTSSQSSLNKKRHLPSVPGSMGPNFSGSVKSLTGGYYGGQPGQSNESPTPAEAMYSDSEVTVRPVFGNRPLYAHPVSMPTSRRYHHNQNILQQQQASSMDDIGDYYQHRQLQQKQHQRPPLPTDPHRLAYQHQYSQEVHSESELSGAGRFRGHGQGLYYPHQSPLQPHQQQQQQQQQRHRHRSSLLTSSSVDYRELKDYSSRTGSGGGGGVVGPGGNYQGDDADGEEEETEFDDVDQTHRNHRQRHYHHRKESTVSQGRRESQPKDPGNSTSSSGVGGGGGGGGGGVADRGGGHHRSSIHRRNSRRKREQQQQQQHKHVGDDSEEETESSSTAAGNVRHSQTNNNRIQKQQQQQQQQQHPQQQYHSQQSFDLMNPNQPTPLPQPQQPCALPSARPKGSRTLNEFTGHRGQQHSAPVHPPHPSRSSLAVARSLSERSKEDKQLESSFSDVPTGGGPKSYSDQIDEVMEQLNANCDFSMDDLYGAANSASTSTLNQPGPDGKYKKNKHGQTMQPGLTKKSQSASQLSVTENKKNRKIGAQQKLLKKSYSTAMDDMDDEDLSDRSKGSTSGLPLMAGAITGGIDPSGSGVGKQSRSNKLSSKLAKSKMIPFTRHNKQSLGAGYYGGIQRSEEILPETFGVVGGIRRGKENNFPMDFQHQQPQPDTMMMDSPMSATSSVRYESSGSGGGGGGFVITASTTSTTKTITDSDSEIWMPQQNRSAQSSSGQDPRAVASGSTGREAEGEFSNFVEGLGPGQIVGRQALAAPNLGDIQLSLHDRKGNLEVEVIRARGLQCKQSAKMIPAPFVKVYLFRNGKCVAKAKTQMARRTLDPLFQQQLLFTDNYKGCILHVVVNGLYGRMDKKSFMGVVQIVLDDLDLTNIAIGWYKLFNESSAISLPQSSKSGGGGSGGSGGTAGGGGSGAASLMSASMDSFS